MTFAARRRGVVAEFDEGAGLGVVDAGRLGRLPFHCTQIAGGTRTILSGTPVSFVIVPGRGGRWEAGDLRPAGEG